MPQIGWFELLIVVLVAILISNFDYSVTEPQKRPNPVYHAEMDLS